MPFVDQREVKKVSIGSFFGKILRKGVLEEVCKNFGLLKSENPWKFLGGNGQKAL